MLVMKFGGASVKDAAAVENVAQIIRRYPEEAIVVVVSAMDKTTNALEELARFAVTDSEARAFEQFEKIKRFHSRIIQQLFGEKADEIETELSPFYREIDRLVRGVLLLQDSPPRIVERIMSFGELLSSTILTAYLKQSGLPAVWADARKLITTDSQFEQAEIIWNLTTHKLKTALEPPLAEGKLVVMAGYIASNTDGYTVTLGREGSDFTASIVAYALDAERMTVWKDVPGVMSADPRKDPDAVQIQKLSYERTIEMTFYGAKVLHPKTLKPLFNKVIPLEVRSFINPELPGTLVADGESQDVEATMIKDQQVLLQIRPSDFSFMGEHLLSEVFSRSAQIGLNINLVQTSAISLTLCVDDKPVQITEFVTVLKDKGFLVERTNGLVLKTILNLNLDRWKPALDALLIQREGRDVRMVLKAG